MKTEIERKDKKSSRRGRVLIGAGQKRGATPRLSVDLRGANWSDKVGEGRGGVRGRGGGGAGTGYGSQGGREHPSVSTNGSGPCMALRGRTAYDGKGPGRQGRGGIGRVRGERIFCTGPRFTCDLVPRFEGWVEEWNLSRDWIPRACSED